jgi:hypothetical protein
LALAEDLLQKASAYDRDRGLGIPNCTNDWSAWQSRSAANVGEILSIARYEMVVLLRNGYQSGEGLNEFLLRFATACEQVGDGNAASEKLQRIRLTCLNDLDRIDGRTAKQRLLAISQILGSP